MRAIVNRQHDRKRGRAYDPDCPTCACGCGTPTNPLRPGDPGYAPGVYRQYIKPHVKRRPLLQGFFEKLTINVDSGCWEWNHIGPAHRYGVFYPDRYHPTYAHRWSYQRFVGPIPDKYVIDHLCRNTRCVNPNHLEAVTHQENTLRGENPPARNSRKTACHRGHPFDEATTYVGQNGARECRICHSARERERQKRIRMAQR